MELKIRNLDDNTISILEQRATKKQVSREEYLRKIIEKEITIYSETSMLDDHASIRHQLANQIERNNYLLKFTQEMLEKKT